MTRRIARLLMAGLTILIFATPAFAAEMTLTGTVGKNSQFQADDGTVYQVKQDDMGETLLVMTGKAVKVTGDVKEKGNKKILIVDEFVFVKK